MSFRKETIGAHDLWLGDCREVLLTLGKVDTVVTDPPYGINWIPRVNHREQIWVDDKAFDPRPFMIGREHLFFGANYFSHLLPPSEAWFLWMKRPAAHDYDRATSYAPCEMAWSDLSGKQRVRHHVWDGGMRAGAAANRTFCHPSQKPIEIMEWCVGETSGQTVLDPFMGSGTTGVACVKLGRRFIGIEVEPRYYEIALKRIEAATRQPDLFIEQPRKSEQLSLLEAAAE
jgi:site-specific DNA-methyltransferase (adenine-specific)/modification methylase